MVSRSRRDPASSRIRIRIINRSIRCSRPTRRRCSARSRRHRRSARRRVRRCRSVRVRVRTVY